MHGRMARGKHGVEAYIELRNYIFALCGYATFLPMWIDRLGHPAEDAWRGNGRRDREGRKVGWRKRMREEGLHVG